MHEEFNRIKDILYSNGFSNNFVASFIGKQLRRVMHPSTPRITVDKAVVYFPITFMGKSSFQLKNKVCRLMNEFYPQISVRVIFKPSRAIRSFFSFKDKVPKEMQSSVIYKLNFGT